MPKTQTLTVRGQKVRTASLRRYIVVAARPTDVEVEREVTVGHETVLLTATKADGSTYEYPSTHPVREKRTEVYGAYGPTIIKRSDSVETARAGARKHGQPAGGYCVVVDTVTGEEV